MLSVEPPLSASVDTRHAIVHLGVSRVAVSYPRSLDPWFAGLVAPPGEPTAPGKWVALARDASGRFAVASGGGTATTGHAVGDALALFWERVSVLLVDDLSDAMALHAGALRRDGRVVLLPGASASGKSSLALWFRAQGFHLGTDEIATVSLADGDLVLDGVLPRPVLLKNASGLGSLPEAGEGTVLREESAYGTLLRLDSGAAWDASGLGHCFIVFPRFKAGAALTMTPLSAGEICLHLIASCLNVRNLPRGGLGFAGALAHRSRAVMLDYGESAQLNGTLDVLTRQVLAAPVSDEDFTALCAAFNARAALRSPAPTAAPAAVKRAVPAETAERFARRLTVGMATYDDYDGVYFTIQGIRTANPELAGEIEFVVVDNNPGGACSEALHHLGKSVDGYRYIPRGGWSGTSIRNAVFDEASSPLVLCIDSHVLIAPGALARLIAYVDANPATDDLLQGPLIYDDLRSSSTHLDPQWRGGMWGIWANDPRGADPEAAAFDIPMQGMGLFACRRTAWAGFNPQFRGFGGEEGYIHEKTRQRGGRTLCLPFLRWVHRFGRPLGAAYVNRWEDRMRNYIIGFNELGLDTAPVEAHFAELLGAGVAERIFAEIKKELALL